MQFGGISHWAILVAGIAGFLFGAVYYGLLGNAWMAALGKTREELMGPGGKPRPGPLVVAFIAAMIMAWILAGLIGHLGTGQVTLRNGLISAGFVWIGFVATTIAVNYGFQGAKVRLAVIDGLHWLGVLLIQGAVIGLFGA